MTLRVRTPDEGRDARRHPPSATSCAGAGAGDANYAILYAAGSATIGRALLTVTANSQTRLFGVANRALTTTVTGFVNEQSLPTSGVTGSARCTTAATAASPGGSYPITCTTGTIASANYQPASRPAR